MTRRIRILALSLACLVALSLPVSAQTRLAVFVVTFPSSDPAPVQTMDWMRQVMTSVDALYAEQSYGQFTTSSDVFGIYTVPLDQTAAHQELALAAKSAAASAGVDLSPYTGFVYISPQTNYVRAGYGDNFGVWIAGLPMYPWVPPVRSVSHELGHHLFGLLHAHGVVCVDSAGQSVPTGSAKGSTCTNQEYGDDLDVMGQGNGHFNAVTKRALGWLMPHVVTASGDYQLAPYESSTGVRSLSVTVPKSPFTFLLEYRQPIGFDALQFYVNPANVFHGVLVHRALNGSELLQMHEEEPTGLRRPALEVGQSWCEDSRMKLTVLSADSTGAIVRVTFGHCK
jgi:hypothetical protein